MDKDTQVAGGHGPPIRDGDAPTSLVLDRRHRGNPEIEYLRAEAILLVLLTHVSLLCIPYPAGALDGIKRWIDPGTGVDLFFVISGYLIGRSFVGPYEAHEQGSERIVRIAAFWVRRIYRLIPAAYVWAGLTFLGSLVFEDPGLWLPPHAMFFKLFASLMSVRNFEESFAPSYFGYYWSLSLENQFYFLLPIGLLLVPRAWRVGSLIALCVLNILWRPGGDAWWLFRYDGLIYGLLLFELERAGYAKLLGDCLPATRGGRTTLMLAGTAVMVVAPVAMIHFRPLGETLVNWAGFVLVLAASVGQGQIIVPWSLRPAVLWIGSRSYSLYLCHIPVWFTVLELMKRTGFGGERLLPWRFAIGLALCAVAADLTYRWLELPLQERGRIRAQAIQVAELPRAQPPLAALRPLSPTGPHTTAPAGSPETAARSR